MYLKFQFPSNGKAHSDGGCWRPSVTGPAANSFNSLQTGRHIQTRVSSDSLHSTVYDRFNSLQTGRHIQTAGRIGRWYDGLVHHVSIPFKREGLQTWKMQT